MAFRMITVNGEKLQAHEGATVHELIHSQGYRVEVIAVEYNGSILKKGDYATTTLQDGDRIEIVSFVGGG